MTVENTAHSPSSTGTSDRLDMTSASNIVERGSSTSVPATKLNLFEDSANSSSDEDSEDGGAQLDEESSAFKINEEYARRFEHNKKREEKQRLEEKYGPSQADGEDSGSESSEDESEDEQAFLLTEDLDAQMSVALQAIKSKDPKIYDDDIKFYDPLEAAQPTTTGESKEKEKPVYLRDYHRERYLRGDIGTDNDAEEDVEKPKTYVQEQEALKQSFLAEANASDSDADGADEDFIKPKEQSKEHSKTGENGIHPSRQARVKISELDVANAEKNPELYLSNFMASRAWMPEQGSQWQAFDSDEEDENHDLADEFENAYNMRFEDPHKSNEVLKSYSRNMVADRSVRREDKKGRKRRREVEKANKEAEKQERQEERARLRKLKVEETHEKLKIIKKAAGMGGKSLQGDEWMGFLEDAWENDKWEEEMNKKFGDEYYAGEDEELNNSGDDEATAASASTRNRVKKPKWDDDIDIGDIDPDYQDPADNPDITLTDPEDESNNVQDHGEDGEGAGEDDDRPTKKRKTTKEIKKDRTATKRAARAERSKIEALVDAQMELDSPSALASSSSNPQGATVAFRYRETSPQSFGLTARDILMAPSDAALNEFVGLKKLASFRDPEKKRKDKKRLGKKARLREWRRDNFGEEFEQSGPVFDLGTKAVANQTPEQAAEQQVGEVGKRKRKRRKSKGKNVAA